MKPQAIVVQSARRIVVGVIAVALVAFSVQLSAKAADDTNVAWYRVWSIKFKPGKTPEALKIIHEHFHKVDKAIGRKVMPFDYTTGEWDHVVYFPLDTARMETVPSDAAFMKAFADQEGGVDQAQKLLQSWLDMIATSKTEIAQLPAAWVP